MAGEKDHKRAAKILRIIAKVIGIIVAVFFLAMIIGDIELSIRADDFQGITPESLFILVPVIIALAAFMVAWRWEFLGGILLILAYLLLSFSPSVHSLFYGEEPRFFIGMFYFASPFLVSGVLFIVAVRLSRRDA